MKPVGRFARLSCGSRKGHTIAAVTDAIRADFLDLSITAGINLKIHLFSRYEGAKARPWQQLWSRGRGY